MSKDGVFINGEKSCFGMKNIFIIFLVILLFVGSASAAHTFDKSATDGTGGFATTNPMTLSYTAGTGSTLMVLNIFTATTTSRAGGAPTFNGKTFTQVGTRQSSGNEGAVEMWYLLLYPANTGSTHTVSVPNTGSSPRAMRIHVSTYKSATGASELDVNAQKSSTSGSNPSQSLTTTANGDVMIDALFTDYSTPPTEYNVGTQLYGQDGGNYGAASRYYLQPITGSQSLSWTQPGDNYALITAAFKEVSPSSGWVAPTNNAAGTGTVTNPQNAYSNNNVYATFSSSNTPSRNYFGYDFSSIPSVATIDRIEVNARGYQSGSGSNRYMQVRLSWNKGANWTSYSPSTTQWTSSNNDHILVGSTDNWGHTWTRDEVVNNFRIEAHWMGSATGYLDYIPVRVYYTAGAGITYSVSGYVTNASSGAAISGAAVTTNTGQSTSTNGLGYYNFSLGNGTYLISASKTGYSGNSTLKTVSGSAQSNVNLTLAPIPASTGQIIVATNRYVILDDPIDDGKTAQTALSFALPGGNGWPTSYNDWSGAQTTITGYALVLDANGNTIRNTPVIFTVRNWNSLDKTTSSAINTDSNGIASYSLNLNNKNYYGNWYVDANATVIGKNSTTGFIYNWWGCNAGGCENHDHYSLGSATPSLQNSPYTLGRERITGIHQSGHDDVAQQDINCVGCHRSYGGTGGGQQFTGQPYRTADVHNTTTCATCHASATTHNSNQPIKSCSDCHTRTDLSNKTTMAGSPLRSTYSGQVASTGHNPDSTIPCILCHGPMHNITKPDETQRFIRNNITEPSHCWACHTNRATTHMSSTNCVSCHSSDVHNISISGGGPDCLACHNTGGSAQHEVDGNAMKSGIHASLNKNSTADAGISADNKKCWGCHQSDGKQPSGMGDIYRTPYKCYDCHDATKPYSNVSNALTVSEHFKNGTDIKAATSASDNSTSCIVCHNLTEMKVTYTDNEFTNFSLPSHYGKNRTDLRINGDSNCLYCHRNTSTAFVAAMNDTNNRNISNHSQRYSSSNPDCSQCHSSGWIHNATLTKPDLTLPNSTYCLSCHGLNSTTGRTNYSSAVTGVKSKHNNSMNCTECHLNNSSDIHPVKFLQSNGNYNTSNSTGVNCVACHQGTTLNANLTKRQISSPLHHSDNPQNGSLWGSYWTNTSPLTACLYCHNDTKHNATPLGRPLNWNSSYKMNTTIGSGTNCADCHYKGDSNYAAMNATFASAGLSKPPEITNGSWMGNPAYYNHSLATYSDSQCKSCHDTSGSSLTVGELLHNVSVGKAGAADCNSCHDIGGSAPAHVNITDMNRSDALHSGLNRDAVISSVDPVNKKCWACHGNGSQPSGHPTNYRTPFVCNDCHILSASQNLNFTPSVILNVSNHYWNGTNISTTASSCYQCHNRSGMLLSTIDPDTGTVYGGINGGIMSPSHYGKKRTDISALVGNDYCNICHNTSTNNATFFVSDYNNSIRNHSISANTPLCAECHNSGRLHDAQLQKPVSNDNLCKNCHGTEGSSLLRNKTEHKTLYCTECHANASDGSIAGKDIHGIKFIQKDNTFSQNRTNAADCTTCHQSNVLGGSLTGFSPPKVSSPLHHSSNINNGSLWGSYWTSPIEACLYCHNDTKHNATPLGRPLIWNSSYVMNTPIGSGTNCADCHYKGDGNYDAMNATFTSAGKSIPPEITNGSWLDKPGYYNHSLNSYTDSQCKGCHDAAGSTTVGQLLHNVNVGQAGGRNCVSCHDIGGSAPVHVNVTALNNSTAIHKNLNSGASATESNNKRCWACHTNASLSADNVVNENELPLSGHPDVYKTPKECIACHRNATIGNMGAKQVYAHQPDAIPLDGFNKSINTTFNCVMCHNNSKLNETQLRISSAETLNGTISHYATKTDLINNKRVNLDQSYCKECHQNLTNGSKYGLYQTKKNHDNVDCLLCHRGGNNIANSLHSRTLLKPVFFYFDITDNYCSGCHAIAPNNSWGAPHGNQTSFVTCTNCHINYTATVNKMTFTAGQRQTGAIYHTDNSTHSYSYNGLAPGNNSYPFGSIDFNRSRCTVCHDRGVEHNVGSDCISCHKGQDVVPGTTTKRPAYHSQNITGGGGPDCLSCHNNSGSATHRIDGGAVALGIHANLNANADSTVPAENKKCWGCHQSNGMQPTGMGDRYKNPYKCTDCHVNDSVPPQASTALNVSNHFVNGTTIKTLKPELGPENLTSCLFCHNKSEMKVDYQEIDGLNSNISLISHYGKNRTDLLVFTNSTNCSYCHQNPTPTNNFTDAFVDLNNTNITHNGENACSVCHGFGRLHNSTLAGGAGGNCLGCHGAGGTAVGRNNIGAADLGRHNNLSYLRNGTGLNEVDMDDCKTCHFDDPHAAGVSKANTYYCESCHQTPQPGIPVSGITSTILFDNAKHGLTDCASCHTANFSTQRASRTKNYHVGNPRGAVFNPGPWTSNTAYSTFSSTGSTTCKDCHTSHNGQDEPFHAPGIQDARLAYHANPYWSCGGCHSDPVFGMGIELVHHVNIEGRTVTAMSINSLSITPSPNVNRGADIGVSFIACYGTCYGDGLIQVELAEYRLINRSTGSTVRDWTGMDGTFRSNTVSVSATIPTSDLNTGDYILQFRAMAGAPRQQVLLPYYPLNGKMSPIQSVDINVIG